MAVEHREHPVVGVQFHPSRRRPSTATRCSTVPARRSLAAPRRCRPAPTASRPGARACVRPRPSDAACCRGAPRRSLVRPAARRAGALTVIVETIVTTVAEDGAVNCAPMGVEWGDGRDRPQAVPRNRDLPQRRWRRAPRSSTSTDDVRVFARAAISNPQYPTCRRRSSAASCWRTAARGASSKCGRSTARRRGRASRRRWCIAACAASSSASTARATPCSRRPSTRRALHLLPRAFVESELARLQVIVDKTAGAAGARGDGAPDGARPRDAGSGCAGHA